MGVSAVARASWNQELHAITDPEIEPSRLWIGGIPEFFRAAGNKVTDAQPKHQQRHRNRETASMKKVYTQGSNPGFCDICEEPFGQMMIEGKSR
jgi:hypothetical protein